MTEAPYAFEAEESRDARDASPITTRRIGGQVYDANDVPDPEDT